MLTSDLPWSFLALCLRMLVFFCCLGLLPWRFVPLSVRLALAVSAVLFLAPLLPGFTSLRVEDAVLLCQDMSKLKGLAASLPYTLLFSEIALGLLLAVTASLAAYSAKLTGMWLSRLIWQSVCRETETITPADAGEGYSLETLFLLVIAAVLFAGSSQSALWALAAQSLVTLPPLAEAFKDSAMPLASGASRAVIDTGTAALSLAFAVALPFFLVSLIVDFVYFPWKRYFAPAFSEHLHGASRALALILLLAISIAPMAYDFSSVVEQSLNDKRAVETMRQLNSAAPVPADNQAGAAQSPDHK